MAYGNTPDSRPNAQTAAAKASEDTAAGDAKAAESQAKADAGQLQGDLDALRKDLAQLTRTVRDIAGARSEQGISAARDYADQAYNQAQEAKVQAEQTIAANPLLSVAAAFGVGYVLGRLMSDD